MLKLRINPEILLALRKGWQFDRKDDEEKDIVSSIERYYDLLNVFDSFQKYYRTFYFRFEMLTKYFFLLTDFLFFQR